jgi:hypothetical protein
VDKFALGCSNLLHSNLLILYRAEISQRGVPPSRVVQSTQAAFGFALPEPYELRGAYNGRSCSGVDAIRPRNRSNFSHALENLLLLRPRRDRVGDGSGAGGLLPREHRDVEKESGDRGDKRDQEQYTRNSCDRLRIDLDSFP